MNEAAPRALRRQVSAFVLATADGADDVRLEGAATDRPPGAVTRPSIDDIDEAFTSLRRTGGLFSFMGAARRATGARIPGTLNLAQQNRHNLRHSAFIGCNNGLRSFLIPDEIAVVPNSPPLANRVANRSFRSDRGCCSCDCRSNRLTSGREDFFRVHVNRTGQAACVGTPPLPASS